MSQPITRKFTIVITGQSDSAYEDARTEALRLIKDGYLCGHNSNHESAFYFDSTDQVPDNERPAQ